MVSEFVVQPGKRASLRSVADKTAYVRAAIEAEGYTLPADFKYRSAKAKIVVINPDGVECFTTWDSWRMGQRTDFRSIVDRLQYLQQLLAPDGYTIESAPSKIVRRSIVIVVRDGIRYEANVGGLLDGARPHQNSSTFVSIERMKSEVAEFGCTLVDPSEYRNNTTRLRLLDAAGVEHSMTWASISTGARPCFKTVLDKEAFIRQAFATEGCVLPADFTYQDAHAEIQYQGADGYWRTTNWNRWQCGKRYCFRSLVDKEGYIRDRLAEVGLTPVEPFIYQGKAVPFKVADAGGNIFKTSWANIITDTHPGSLKFLISKSIRRRLGECICDRVNAPVGSVSRYAVGLALQIEAIHGSRPDGSWHLDHVVPHSFFNYENQDEISLCWHPQNVRWLLGEENVARNNRLTEAEVALMNDAQRYILIQASRRGKYGWGDKRLKAAIGNFAGYCSLVEDDRQMVLPLL